MKKTQNDKIYSVGSTGGHFIKTVDRNSYESEYVLSTVHSINTYVADCPEVSTTVAC
jgi:hypothetical protein